MNIDYEKYFEFARNLTEKEKILITLYQKWLPEQIIDCHSHSNLKSHIRYVDKRAYQHMLSTFPVFSIQESQQWNALLHPHKHILSLRFSNVFRGIDHKQANLYLLKQSPKQDRIALFGLSDDIQYTIDALSHPRVSALKMYHSYPIPSAKKIYEYFPKEILKAAQKNSIPIILHPPLPIAECANQFFKLTKDFPDLKICLAHIGLTKSLSYEFKEVLQIIAQNELVRFDTALVPSANVIEVAIKILGPEKIMYGSDAPMHLVRSVAYQNPQKGRRLATTFPYHWVDKTEQRKYGCLAQNTTHDHWKAIEAIRKAILRFPKHQQEDIKRNIFYKNAKLFFNF